MSLIRIRRRKYYNATIFGAIDDILDRFSKRFGRISNDDAERLQIKLAEKYSSNILATLRTATNNNICGFSYPREESLLENKRIIYEKRKEELRLKRVKEGFSNPVGDFCLLPYKYSHHSRCECCGTMVNYEIGGRNIVSKAVHNAVYLNEWRVCRDKRCRTVAKFFKRGRKDFPLINVLNEVTKHGGNNENKRRLEKHFIRHA